MKTYVTYGLGWALAGMLLMLVLFFLGFHSSVEKLESAQWIGIAAGLVVAIAFLVLGTKARRNEVPLNEPFGYGRALGAAVMITLFASLFGMVGNYIYMHLINPGMLDLSAQAQIEKWEAAGMSSSQIEAAEGMMRKMMHPVLQAVFYFLGATFFGVLLALITSIFLRRPAVEAAPPPPPPVTS